MRSAELAFPSPHATRITQDRSGGRCHHDIVAAEELRASLTREHLLSEVDAPTIIASRCQLATAPGRTYSHCTCLTMSSTPPTRQRQPSGKSLSPEDISLPARTESNGAPRRRPSFSFLRRSKSTDRVAPSRSVSGAKLTKKQRAEARERDFLKEQIPQRPPRIPDLPHPPQLHTFGGEESRPDSLAIVSNLVGDYNHHRTVVTKGPMDQPSPRMYPHVPIPPIPASSPGINGGFVDPYARSESMTNRGRYSYASSAVSTINNPRKMRRRKDPTPFKLVGPHAL